MQVKFQGAGPSVTLPLIRVGSVNAQWYFRCLLLWAKGCSGYWGAKTPGPQPCCPEPSSSLWRRDVSVRSPRPRQGQVPTQRGGSRLSRVIMHVVSKFRVLPEASSGGQGVYTFLKEREGRRLLHQRQPLCPFQGAGLLKFYWHKWLII